MKITKKFLHEIVTFLFEQACEDIKKSDLEIDQKYFEGRRNSYELIRLLIEGDNDELLDVLRQIQFKEYSNYELEVPF